MKISFPNHNSSTQGFKITELMVCIAVGALVLTGVSAAFVGGMVSFSATGNYVSLDQSSENALDRMTRDVRVSANLTSFATNQLVFNYAGTTNLYLIYNSAARTLNSWKTGDSSTNVLLTGCDSLLFSMYTSVPQLGGSFTNATTLSSAKAISVSWRCSRSLIGSRRSSEDIQEAVIVIRNKPVS